MANKIKKSVWDSDYPVTLTGISPRMQSQSNSGSYYRAILAECIINGVVTELKKQYVDESMKNYDINQWDLVCELLDDGQRVTGRGCVKKYDHSNEYTLDCDHFTVEDIVRNTGPTMLFEWHQ